MNSLKALAHANATVTSLRDRLFLLRTWLGDRETRILLSHDLFDPKFYLANYPDVKAAKADPLIHYLRYGKKERRKPSASVDTSALFQYRRQDADSRQRISAFAARIGLSQLRLEQILADPSRGQALLGAEQNPDFWRWYKEARESAFFDAEYYRRLVPQAAEIDPLAHYLIWGYCSYLDPSPQFRCAEYYLVNHDAREARHNPLLHWLQIGRFAGRPKSVAERDEKRNRALPFPIGLDLAEQSLLERMRGDAYLGRFGFTLEKTSSLEFAKEAIDDFASRKPALTIAKERPDVSIIIPVYGQLQVLLNCLDALCVQASRFTAEIIVIDDASPAEAGMEAVAEIPWIRYLRREKNKGFVGSCNFAASQARGKYLLFLNNDTRVLPGWLDELIGSFELFPKAGLVGSKLINADGSLQEAGGIVWRDGTVWNYGRGESPERPEFCYARRADYCSGASIAVLKSAWQEVGGFDFFYTPAYCEDLDLAFKLRRAGYEVWFQPLSLVLHYEGRSHGRDETVGIKAYQVRNLKTFYQRWHDTLTEHGLPHPFPHGEADRTRRQHVLVIDATTPTPDRDSGSNNTVELMRIFLHMGWHVAFAPRSHAFAGDYTKALQRIGVEPLIAPLISHLGDLFRNRPEAYDAVIAFRLESLGDCYEKLRAAYPGALLIFHDIDLHHLRLKRRAEITGDLALHMESERVKDRELELFARCDCSVVVTEAEKATVQEQLPVENIVVYPYTIEVRRSERPFSERRHLCFIGGYAHDPNVDAVLYFAREIWPLVKPELPDDAKLLIVGPDAPPCLKSLAADDIVLTGQLSDLGDIMDDCRLSVVPLRYGAGIKGKLVRSLAYGLPSVASSLAVEGMQLTNGREVLVADEPQLFAKAILTLYHDRQKWQSVQSAGYTFVEEHYSWKVGLQTCERILRVAGESWILRKAAARQKRLAEILNGATE